MATNETFNDVLPNESSSANTIVPNLDDGSNVLQMSPLFQSLKLLVIYLPTHIPCKQEGSLVSFKKKVFVASILPSDVEPSSFTKASKFVVWQNAMLDEYQALMMQQTWTL